MSISRGMDKDVAQIYNRLSLSHKKEWNNAICSNMDEPRGYHTKKSQSRIIQKITYMQNLKCDANELIYETDSQTIEDRLAKGEETGKEKDWGPGISRCKLLDRQNGKTSSPCEHREPCSISCDKPWWKRMWKRIYIFIFLCYTAEINTTL